MHHYVLVFGLGVCIACGDDSTSRDAEVDTVVDAGVDVMSDDAGVGCALAPLCGDLDVVVDRDYVAANLDDPRVQRIDVRSATAFDSAHLPGALLVDVATLRATVDGIGGQVVDAATAESVLGAAGVRNDASIIVYGDDTNTTPARLVWTLEYFGHDRVAMLDGGFADWDSVTETGPFVPVPTTYVIDEVDVNRRVDPEFIVPRLGMIELVDARTAAEYDAGHIPGAHSVDWMSMVSSGALLPRSELDLLYADVDSSVTVVAYCQSGARASVTYVALRMLGFADVRLYDGSWAEWGSRPELPREP